MDSQDSELLGTLVRWLDEAAQTRRQVALVTLARACGSTPRSPGAWLAVRADGLLRGSVSGGCIEDDLVAQMRAGRLAGPRPFVLRYGETDESARRFGLPCGGMLELVVEPAPDAARLAELAARIASGARVRRTLDMNTGEVRLTDEPGDDAPRWDGATLSTCHGPRRRMLLIGAGPISRVLAQMAPALDFAVSVCDPRDEYAREWDIAGCPLAGVMPDDAVRAMHADVASVVVALTHDPKLDDLALLEALNTPAFYVGALGSVRTNERRRRRLAEHFQCSAEQLARLHGPVGLPIGSRTPPEIAVAILADIIAALHGKSLAAAAQPTAGPAGTPDSRQPREHT